MDFSFMIKTLLLSIAYLLLTTPSSGQHYNHLLSGERLNTGQALTQGGYVFIIQDDCNLVLYENGNPIWASNTGGLSNRCYLSMQNDGNLVVYDTSNRVIWASNTNGKSGYYNLILQKDRNVVIYSVPTWSTDTSTGVSTGVIIAPAHNETVMVSGAEQNMVRKIGKIVEVVKSDE